jgi:hypothetical protein
VVSCLVQEVQTFVTPGYLYCVKVKREVNMDRTSHPHCGFLSIFLEFLLPPEGLKEILLSSSHSFHWHEFF